MLDHSLRYILHQFAGAEVGEIQLAAGIHELSIPLPDAGSNIPYDVFLAIEEADHQVCGRDTMSTARAIPGADGFDLIATITSDKATISWLAF